ncbi:polyphosphate polymerase domain-containing protein [Senegalia massiliensis]|jgi:hypothetical protein|uniref:Polyphosphate polymerase domain-containing protein n=1 Tax=Senegalia massiliensis TaxID=1720316 RepID=A0A845QVV5_9CLOT|nr:polyphosphate polymerase domain-containing protein [Senegalia massiliensis]NBI06134.1 polyphosphate polymerase domain-containing protein [Senegalia massiliensis]
MSENILSVSRKELKYKINFMQYVKLSYVLSSALTSDKNNGVDGYTVRSLYFDTYNNMDFYDKLNGVENRKKIRLRLYRYDSDKVKLEIKKKYGDNQQKKTVWIDRLDAEELIKCNYEVLKKYKSNIANTIYNIMKIDSMKPVVLIEYKRKAFVHAMNNIRLTLDSQIHASETNFDFFAKNPIMNPVENFYYPLLEVKFNGFIHKWIADLIKIHSLNKQSFSKYVESRKIFHQYMA